VWDSARQTLSLSLSLSTKPFRSAPGFSSGVPLQHIVPKNTRVPHPPLFFYAKFSLDLQKLDAPLPSTTTLPSLNLPLLGLTQASGALRQRPVVTPLVTRF